INTFGGTWFEEDWTPKVNTDGFADATKAYVDAINKYGIPGNAQAGFSECYSAFIQGNVAIWFDDTAAANIVEADGEPMQGKTGYAAAPTKKTDSGGMLYSWAWTIQKDAPN